MRTPTVLDPGNASALDSRERIVDLLEESAITDSTALKQLNVLRKTVNEKMYNVFIFL